MNEIVYDFSRFTEFNIDIKASDLREIADVFLKHKPTVEELSSEVHDLLKLVYDRFNAMSFETSVMSKFKKYFKSLNKDM